MGPRLGSRGKRAGGATTAKGFDASMGPRLGSRGKIAWRTATLEQNPSFNGAATWKSRKGATNKDG